MSDRFVTVPDSLELPAAVKVPIARLSDAGTAGRAVLDAETTADGRTALGLGGAAVLNVGTAVGTVKAGDYQPTAANISDSTAAGRALLTAVDAEAQRNELGLGGVPGAVESVDGQTGDVSLSSTYAPHVEDFRYLECMTAFFGGSDYYWQTGQSTTPTTLAAGALAGASAITVADATGIVANELLVLDPGTATQEVVRVSSIAGAPTLTLAAALAYAHDTGEVAAPVWNNSSHITGAGTTAMAHWMLTHASLADISGKVVLLGNSWFDLNRAEWAAQFAADAPGVTLVNVGVGGNTSVAMDTRFAADVPADADFVILNEPGVNDATNNFTINSYLGALESLVNKIRAIGAVPVLLGPPPLSTRYTRMVDVAGKLRGLPASFPAMDVVGQLGISPAVLGVGSGNTALGVNAMIKYEAIANCTAFGQGTLAENTGGSGSNTAVGYNAGNKLTTGYNATTVGSSAGASATTARDMTAVGVNALTAATGIANTALGSNAGHTITTGIYNTIIGQGASAAAGTSYGTALGAAAAGTGSYGTALGPKTTASGAGSVAIGCNDAGTGATATAANAVTIGTSSHSTTIPGKFNVAQRTPASAGAAGTAGEVCWDADYVYVCTAANTWKRVGIATW